MKIYDQNAGRLLKALSICVPETQDDSKLECSDCPYGAVCNPNDIVGIPLPLIWDIRALLKEQEEEIEKLKEIIIKADSTLEIVKERLNELLYEDFRRV